MSPVQTLAACAAAALLAVTIVPGTGAAQATATMAPVQALPVAVIETGAHAGPIVAWDVQGNRLVTAGADKTVRLWALPSLRPITVIRPPQGADDDGAPVSVALHPAHRRVAVLVRRTDAAAARGPMAIYEYALPSFELVMPLAARRDAAVGTIAYGRDGVLSTGPRRAQAEIAPIGDAGEVHFFDTGTMHVLDASGRNVATVESSAFDVAPASLRVGRDGRFVEFGDAREPGRSIAFGVDPAAILEPGRLPMTSPTAAAAGLLARLSADAGRVLLDGRPLPLAADAVATRVEIAPDARRVYVGSTRGLHAFDATGRALWSRPFDAAVRALAASPGGETLVAALADGTLRWTQSEAGGALLSLFVNRHDREWVLWNPNGYFTASPFGDRHLGWLRSADEREPEFIGTGQLERVLYRPDFVGCTVRCLGDSKPSFNALGQPVIMAAFSQFAPPKVRILSITREASHRHRVRFVAEAARLPMLDWGVFANGIPVVPLAERRLADGPTLRIEREVVVDTPDALTTLRIEAFNGRSVGRAEAVVEEAVASTAALPKGDLYLLAIGIDRFADLPEEMQLQYSGTDAATLAKFLGRRHARRFDRVNVRVVTEQAGTSPTKENILAALDFFANAGADDTVVLFLASHAVSDRAGNYFFIPADVKADDVVLLEQGKVAGEASAIAWTRLVDGLRVAAGRRLMIVDTCHAEAIRGRVDLASLVRRSAAAHFAILTASRSDELAMELDSARHGLFTYALLRGLFGEGDLDGDARITLGELHRYVVPTVRRLRPDPKLSQTPQLVAPAALLDHPLADLRRAVAP